MSCTNLGNVKTIFAIITLAISSLLVSGCGQSIAVESNSNVSDEAIKQVNYDFRKRFVYGDWRYHGAINIQGKLRAVIQIPAKLSMSEEQQASYIKATVCPSFRNENLWHSLQGVALEVQLYTNTKADGIATQCNDPLQQV